MLEVKNLSVRYPLQNSSALRDVNLNLLRGQIGVVTGGNDSGKSTLLNRISKIALTIHNAQSEGECLVSGTIGAVLQDSDLFLMPTVEEELEFPLFQYGYNRKKTAEKIAWLSDRLNLKKHLKRSIHSLSGGERQMVAFAAAIAADSDLLLLDEPLSQLDPAGAVEVVNFIRNLADQGKTILIASAHLKPFDRIADKYFWLEQGKVIWSGRPDIFKSEHERARSMGVDVDGWGLFNRPPVEPTGQAVSPPTEMKTALEMDNVSYAYEKGFSVENINLKIDSGKITVISGKNGSGKTTLLKMAAAIIKPQQGVITVLGKRINDLSIAEATENSGFLFQNPDHQIFQTQVDKELTWGLNKRGFSRQEAEERKNRWLERLSLFEIATEHPYSLSKTCRQWIALAGVLVREPSLLLLDEPTFGMDTVASRRFADMIRQVACEGATVLMITHNIALAAHCADYLIGMEEGALSIS